MTTGFDRPPALAALTDREFDVVIVGGGITGAGAALDAASRGLRTALIERDDFASGTSSKSSKLVHGGLRYLQQREIRLVYEALAERHLLLKNAPHLVRELGFLLPIFHKNGIVPKKVARTIGGAMWGYDLTGGARIGKLHKRLNAAETLAHMPSLRADRVDSSYLYYDASADDARLTLALVRTAVLDHGAVAANGVALTGLDKSEVGRVRAVIARTAEGDELAIRTRAVINATGVWADDVRSLDEAAPSTIRPAKGVHITLDAAPFATEVASILPVPGDRRSVFLIPWGDQMYAGTTDTDFDGDVDDPQCTPDDVAYLLRAVRASTTVDVDESAVTGTWAGLRPLVADASSERTADLSRRHQVATSQSGVITVTGGKLTTYRRMAADAVAAAVELLGPAPTLRTCRTKQLPIRGATGLGNLGAGTSHLSSAQVEHLRGRYGGEAGVVLALIEKDPTLAEPMVPALPYLAAEAVYSARYEMVRNLDDLLARRTRAQLRDLHATRRAAPDVARLVAGELRWSDADQRQQVQRFVESCDAEHNSWLSSEPQASDA